MLTIIAIAVISEAIATLVRTGELPRSPAASRAAGERSEKSRRATSTASRLARTRCTTSS